MGAPQSMSMSAMSVADLVDAVGRDSSVPGGESLRASPDDPRVAPARAHAANAAEDAGKVLGLFDVPGKTVVP